MWLWVCSLPCWICCDVFKALSIIGVSKESKTCRIFTPCFQTAALDTKRCFGKDKLEFSRQTQRIGVLLEIFILLETPRVHPSTWLAEAEQSRSSKAAVAVKAAFSSGSLSSHETSYVGRMPPQI